MNSPSALRRLPPSVRRWLVGAAVLTVLGAYGWFLGARAVIAPAGADSSGYFNFARLLVHGQLHYAVREIEQLPAPDQPWFLYCPHGLLLRADQGHLVPTYPVGYPLLLAPGLTLGDAVGPRLVMVLHALALVGLTFCLARRLRASVAASALAAAAVGASPLFINLGLVALSDLPATTWATAALVCALGSSRRSAVAAGFCAGLAFLIRPTNALLLLPLLIARGGFRRTLWCSLGGLPAVLLWLGLNRALYGHALMTGYGDVRSYFSFTWVPATLLHYLRWLPVAATPLVVLVVALPWAKRLDRRAAAAVGAWVLALGGFYACYNFTHREWLFMRFLAPALPALIALAAVAGADLLSRPRWRRWATPVVGMIALVIPRHGFRSWHELHMHNAAPAARAYLTLTELVRTHVPTRGVVLAGEASGTLFYGVPHVIVRWDCVENAWPRVQAAARAAERPVYAALMAIEDPAQFRARVPGDWQLVARGDNCSLWRLAP